MFCCITSSMSKTTSSEEEIQVGNLLFHIFNQDIEADLNPNYPTTRRVTRDYEAFRNKLGKRKQLNLENLPDYISNCLQSLPLPNGLFPIFIPTNNSSPTGSGEHVPTNDVTVPTPLPATSSSSSSNNINNSNTQLTQTRRGLGQDSDRVLPEGRIGAERVCLCVSPYSGKHELSHECQLRASSADTVLANSCVFRGRWMYEVTICSNGSSLQVGWSNADCQFDGETGVGECLDSYAYDGHKVLKWNASLEKYGEEWCFGDVIGCAIDMDDGIITFYRNGKSLGDAFRDIQRGPGYAYYPSITVGKDEECIVNFGQFAMRYPIKTYSQMMSPPVADLLKSRYLLQCLKKLVLVTSHARHGVKQFLHSIPPQKVDVLTLIISHQIFEHLLPFLIRRPSCQYILQEEFLPICLGLCEGESVPNSKLSPGDRSPLHALLDTMLAVLQESESEQILRELFWLLSVIGLSCASLTSSREKMHWMQFAKNLLSHERTLHLLIKSPNFIERITYILHVRYPSQDDLNKSLPHVWWDKAPFQLSDSHKQVAKELNSILAELQALQADIMSRILFASGPDPTYDFLNLLDEEITVSENALNSNKFYFSLSLRKMVEQKLIRSKNGVDGFHSTLYSTLFFISSLTFIKVLSREYGAYSDDCKTPMKIIIDGNITFRDDSYAFIEQNRCGGLFAYLQRSIKQDSDQSTNSNNRKEPSYPLRSSARVKKIKLSQESSTNSMDVEIGCQSSSTRVKLIILPPDLTNILDSLVFLYHTAVHHTLSLSRGYFSTLSQFSKALTDTQCRLGAIDVLHSEVISELDTSRQVFEKKCIETAQMVTWLKGQIFTKQNFEALLWMFRIILDTIEYEESQGQSMAFLPEIYIISMVHLYRALRMYFVSPDAGVEGHVEFNECLHKMASLLCQLCGDSRILNPDIQEKLFEALLMFLCFSDTMKALEAQSADRRRTLLLTLMSSFNKRNWIHPIGILVRFWKGDGYVYKGKQAGALIDDAIAVLPEHDSMLPKFQPSCPSQVFQDQLAQICLQENTPRVEFINGILNQLNSVFSEVIETIQELQHKATLLNEQTLNPKELRICTAYYHLTIGLLRILEMLSCKCPGLFLDQKSSVAELSLNRLVEVLIQVWNRITAHQTLFDNAIRLRLPGLESIEKMSVLYAVAGVILALCTGGSKERNTYAVKCIVTSPGFSMKSAELLLQAAHETMQLHNSATNRSNILKIGVTTEEELIELDKLMDILKQQGSTVVKSPDIVPQLNEDSCPICCAKPISVVFHPCGHSTCKECITRHLMNGENCFFCNQKVVRFQDLKKSKH